MRGRICPQLLKLTTPAISKNLCSRPSSVEPFKETSPPQDGSSIPFNSGFGQEATTRLNSSELMRSAMRLTAYGDVSQDGIMMHGDLARRVRGSNLLGNTVEFGCHNVDSFAQLIDFILVRSGIGRRGEERRYGRARKERQTAITVGARDLLSIGELGRG